MSVKTGFMICAGAICQCKFGKAPAKFKVLTQKKHYINDEAGTQKLLATHKELGQPFEPPFFGSCAKMNNSACTVNVIDWDGFYEKSTIENGGHPLTDSSRATCPIGAKGCISITWHGQVSTPSAPQIKNAEPNTLAQINPLANSKKL
ncbi:hypothetical protein ABIB40_003017 [Pedobacter sp. UYP30]|uniref:DUF4280 domain-containing protein n=1 Tax=Pedobacter sp. UYP30 TaxID=1756400 RepID=UPI003391C0B1